jgi:hypothetical protein
MPNENNDRVDLYFLKNEGNFRNNGRFANYLCEFAHNKLMFSEISFELAPISKKTRRISEIKIDVASISIFFG